MFEVNVISERNKKKMSWVFNISCYGSHFSFGHLWKLTSERQVNFCGSQVIFSCIWKSTFGSVFVKQKSTSGRQVNFCGSQVIFSHIRKLTFESVCVKQKSTSENVCVKWKWTSVVK